MKISYNWLQEYFEKPLPNPKDLADLLNIRSFEVEEIEEKDGDSILEIKITPNRAPDCLSHDGIAREVSVHTGLPLIRKEILGIKPNFKTNLKTSIEDETAIRHMCREIKNVKLNESPLELKLKLEAIGQRPINVIVDITNLVMNETGQPLHAFDADKISGSIIKIAKPTDLSIVTLGDKEVVLTTDDITLQDAENNLDIAGIKGGKKAEVNSETKNIILESANFFAVKVRKASKRTGIQTDSSKRFENGISPELAQKGIELVSHYIKMYASGEGTQFSDIVDVYPRPQNRKYVVGLNFKNIEKKLGIKISDEKIKESLTKLGIEFSQINSREEITKNIQGTIGKKYVYGASVLFDAPNVFDCSSLSSYLYSVAGISIPRVSIDQFVYFTSIDKKDAQPGDLVFANTGKVVHGIHFETKEFLPGTKVENGVDHVGIYMGDNKVIHANSRTGNVVIEDLENNESFKDIRGFGKILDIDEPKYLLQIPYERLDLKTEIDIIEEVGRVYGYENIISVPANISNRLEEINEYEKITTLKSHLIDLGFDEVITYAFQNKGDIAVTKPLANDKGYLRTNLAKGLSDALELNFKNKDLFAIDVVKIFEIGHIFTNDEEKIILGLGVKSGNKKQKTKNILEETIKYLSEKLEVELNIEIKDQQEIIEIDLTPVFALMKKTYNSLYSLTTKPYEPFSLYPFMSRDIAVWSSNAKTKADIEKIIIEKGTKLLMRYDLFDEFSKEGKTSYAYRLVFQSYEKTLTDEEINPIMENIYNTLKMDSDFEIR